MYASEEIGNSNLSCSSNKVLVLIVWLATRIAFAAILSFISRIESMILLAVVNRTGS